MDTTIREAQDQVEKFQRTKRGFTKTESISELAANPATQIFNDDLFILSQDLIQKSKSLLADFEGTKDLRIYRLSLLIEEIGEYAEALSDGDEVKAADAIGDSIYILLGDAVTYNIPAQNVVMEIHKSNMTKVAADESNYRMRNKGPSYQPPDIRQAIDNGREMVQFSKRVLSI